MKLAIALFTASVSLSVSSAAERLPGGSNFEVLAFDGQLSFIDAELSHYPSDELARSLIPAAADSSYRIEWDCSLTTRGKLTRCKVDRAWPKHINLRPIALALLPQFSIRQDDAARIVAANGTVHIDAYLDDNTRKLNRDCPPGWCPHLPAPPAAPGSH